MNYRNLPIKEFKNKTILRNWLVHEHASSTGIWVRVYKTKAGVESISFEELLDQGLCFGWSESLRLTYDDISYLQKFTPRKTRGTTSKRNLEHAQNLIANGEMTAAGLQALGLE